MGFFGTYLLTGDTWSAVPELAPEAVPRWVPAGPDPWLYVEIHDSDLTILRYGPAGPGSGIAFLGYTPRTYFEDDDASDPTNVDLEAAGLAAWLALRPYPPAGVDAAAIKPYLAADLSAADLSAADLGVGEFDAEFGAEKIGLGDVNGFGRADEFDDDLHDDLHDDLDDGEIFVEIKTARFLRLLGLPLPEDLPQPT